MHRPDSEHSDRHAAPELAAIDAALAGEPVEGDFDELARLVGELRAGRPRARARYIEDLDRKAATRFGAAEARGRSRATKAKPGFYRELSKRLRRMPALRPALAVGLVAASVTAGVVFGGSFGGDSEQREVLALEVVAHPRR